eukprot:651340-Karenia_brevis.AAC.1
MAPISEAKGVLNAIRVPAGRGGQDDCRRPADVLLCRACDVETGVAGVGNGRVALDVGVVCPQAQGHMAAAAAESLGAISKRLATGLS